MGGALQFRVLGPLAVEQDGGVLELRSQGQRALLAGLLVRANQPVPHDALAEAVWEGAQPNRAEDVLRVHVSQLRKRLAREAIVTVAGGYLLRVAPERVDAHRFEELVRAGERALRDGDDLAADEALADGLALWRGAPYDDVRDRAHFQPEIRRLEELRLEALEHRAEAQLRLGRAEELAGELVELVERHPHRERLSAQLMLALYRSGRQADALDTFRRVRRRLQDDLGLEPGPELRRLERRILRQEAALERHARVVRLPSPLTSFVGRTRELGETAAAVGSRRLVTLVGAGGSGKTRLAIETARGAADGFPDGTWFVDLAANAGSESPAGLVRVVLGAAQPGPATDLDALLLELETRRALLVLDNCEHVLDRTAALVSALLERCRDLHVLATSRERLGIPGELVYQVPTLTLPEPGTPQDGSADAVALFHTRARDSAPGFVPDRTTEPTVVEIVRALDGIPLAIELAAGRLAALPLDRLAETVRAAMPELGAGSRVAVPRHATLRAAFAWSVELLAAPERELFARLWVFEGGWSIDALATLGDDSERALFAQLARLVAVSLVEAGRRGADVRYRLLEPVRQYARSLVPDEDSAATLRTAHMRVYLDLGLRTYERFDRGGTRSLDTWATDEANMISALDWALRTHATEDAARLARSLGTYWSHTGQFERARYWLGRALDAADGVPNEVHADLLASAGRAATLAGDGERGERLLGRAKALLRGSVDAEREARLLNELGNAHALRGNMRAAASSFEASQDTARRAGATRLARRWLVNLGAVYNWQGDTRAGEQIAFRIAGFETERDDGPAPWWTEGMSLVLRGQSALFAGDAATGQRHLQASAPLIAVHGMRSHHALCLVWQALAALALDEPARAAALVDEARAVAPRPPGWSVRLPAPEILGWAAVAEAEPHTARGHAVTAAQTSLEVDNLGGMARSLDLIAVLEHQVGAPDRAAVLLAASTAARQDLAHARAPHESRAAAALEAALEADLGARRLAELRKQADALDLRAAVELALGVPYRSSAR